MRHPESPAAMLPASGRTSVRRVLPHWRPRLRAAAIAVVAVLGIAAAVIVASAERDVYLRTHPAVPGLVGKTVAEAARMIQPLHFGILVTASYQDPNAPMGIVLTQNPPPGRRVPVGWVVQLKVSQGSGLVPRLRGHPVHEAARRLETVGLRLGRVIGIEDDAVPGTVLEQFVPSGHRLDANSPVDVLVSHGPEVAIPPAPAAAPGAPSPTPASAASFPVPAAATPSAGLVPGTMILRPEQRTPAAPQHQQEGAPSVGSASTDCAVHPERERAEVCPQPAADRGAEPDVHRPEHRDVPPGP